MTSTLLSAEDYLKQLRQDIVFHDKLKGDDYEFHTTWGLFSPKAIDNGTRLLLDHLDIRPDDRALDLGCGYGPIGLTIARNAPQGFCTLVDKDFVAIEYAQKNAAINHISNVNIQLSDGCRDLGDETFTLVVTNLPAKTSKEHYYLFFYDAFSRMQPGARIYVVVISGLRKFIAKAFMQVFGNHKKIKQGQTYTVAMATRE
ncbi:MAG: methyltransferase [Chromatiales bacterium]|jgi:16S rRNA G1207 methylase RsmC